LSQDGESEAPNKFSRQALVNKLNRYIQLQRSITELEDPVLFRSCQESILSVKEEIRSLNSPHDQLKNLQGAITRKQKIVSDLTSQSSALQNQILSVNNEVLNLQEIEKKLIGQISHAPISMQVNEDQYLQMQLRLSLMEQSMRQERTNMDTFLSQLQAVPNLPEDAIKLMPITTGPAASPTPLAPSAPLSPPGPPGSPGGSATGMPTGYDSFDGEDDYGPLSTTPSRPSPYGPAPQSSSVFGEVDNAAPPG